MSATRKKQAEEESFSIESDDDFQYEEVSVEDGLNVTEGEEDLEATVKAIQNRAEASAAAAAAAAAATAAPAPQSNTSVDDFLRNFLTQMGMTETLDCFQIEWTEMSFKGQVDRERVGVVPDVYVENQHLENELKNAHREREEYRLAVSAAAETLGRVQKARDHHRLQHKRVVQEKNRLIEEMRKLKVQCNRYEPAVKRMNEKYQTVLKQTMLMTLEQDKASGQGKPVDGTAHPVIQPRPPTATDVGARAGV